MQVITARTSNIQLGTLFSQWFKLIVLQIGIAQVMGLHAQTSLDMIVKESQGIERSGEMIRNGIPIGRGMGLKNIANLKVTDKASGKQIAAQFEVLSRWGGSLQSDSSIQWLLVTFPADLKMYESKTFTLSTGLNIAPTNPLTVASTVSSITISTGVAKFTLDKTAFSILQSGVIVGPDGKETNLIGSVTTGSSIIDVQGAGVMTAGAPEEVVIEHQGALFVTVKMRGHYSSSVPGGKSLTYIARYNFYAGSPSMEMDFHFYWAGSSTGGGGESLNQIGIILEEQTKKSILVNSIKLRIPLNISGPLTGSVRSEVTKGFSGPLPNDGSVSLTQYRLESQFEKPKYLSRVGGHLDSGAFAETPFIMTSGASGGVAATIQKMKFYGPQSMLINSNFMEISIISQPQYLSPYTGGYAKLSVILKSPLADSSTFQPRAVVASDHRLFAWPSIADVSKSMVLGEMWDGTPSSTASTYLKTMETISQNTLNTFIDSAMYGFMTYGLPARYMSYGTEGGGNKTWDGFYWNGSFTDYHNTMSNSVYLFAQTGNSEWLYNLAFPAARRTLKTQIVQSDVNDSGYFSGWAPAGYGGYRKDPNSCHSYFENLYLYYYLTGDRETIENLQKAGNTLRKAYTRDKVGKLVSPELPNPSPWVYPEGRVSSQHSGIFWFLGHATSDNSFLDDYRNQMERLASLCMVLVKKESIEYAFINQNPISATQDSMVTEQNWMLGLFAMNDFWKLYSEYGDLELGKDRIKISRIFAGVERSTWEFTAKVHAGGDGTANGLWANSLIVHWNGSKIGGNLKQVAFQPAAESHLFATGKALLTTLSFRAGVLNPNVPAFNQHGLDLYNNVFEFYKTQQTTCWDKEQGEYFSRIHPALKYISQYFPGRSKIQEWRKKSKAPVMPRVRPFSGMLQIKNLRPGSEFSVLTLSGKQVLRKEFEKEAESYQINLTDPTFSHTSVLLYRFFDPDLRMVETGRLFLNPMN